MEVSKQDLPLSLYQARDKNLKFQQFLELFILLEHEELHRRIPKYHLVFLSMIMHHINGHGNGLLNEGVKEVEHNSPYKTILNIFDIFQSRYFHVTQVFYFC